ncbi:WAT1-related protein At1g25270-like [Dioscorea cayenensis subsp. rotundata]|uniref:WAT1-related protein n=1 Tax=Dioscorea cayennensis subsp. rotundata TaxID=55577 RepID=A0AB40B8D6_DIOCR|nr:WAT1-related protein At1g25270-like [Dioscorea cayenensis subsp. rotundata]
MGEFDLHEELVKMKPALCMACVQVVFAGINILYKLAVNDGMDMRIMITYRYIFATAFLSPLAYFIERKKRPGMTWMTLLYSLLSGFFGGALAQNLYIASIKLTSATFASAMTNLIPAMTFILAIIFRYRTCQGQAKVLGTLIGIGGAMLLTFYKGVKINIWPKSFNIMKAHQGKSHAIPHQDQDNLVKGLMLAFASCISYSIWLIIQAKATKLFPCQYSLTALMCLMAAVQSACFALAMDPAWVQWRMEFNVRLLTVVYSGILASGLSVTVMAWCIRKKGPLYTSVFNPLMLVIVALLGSLLLDEKLHLGSVLGAVLIVLGLYIVLWGKGREAAKITEASSTDHDSIHVIVHECKTAQESSFRRIS